MRNIFSTIWNATESRAWAGFLIGYGMQAALQAETGMSTALGVVLILAGAFRLYMKSKAARTVTA